MDEHYLFITSMGYTSFSGLLWSTLWIFSQGLLKFSLSDNSAGLHLLPLQYGRAAVIYVCNTSYHSPQFLIFHGKLSNKSEISHVNNYPIYLFSLPFLFLLTWQVYKPSLLDKSFPVLTTCLTNIYQLS